MNFPVPALRRLSPSCLLLAALALTGCGPAAAVVQDGEPPLAQAEAELHRIPSEGRPDTVDVVSWNVEWLGSTREGPSDEALQQANVARVLRELDVDLIGLVEVVSPAAFEAVVAALPGRQGLLVTDPRVVGGADFYRPWEQKVALVFDQRFTVESARVVLTEAQSAFAGRPPMEVKLRFYEDGRVRTLVVVVAHFKAMANLDGYTRRSEAAVALKAWLDATYPSRWVLVVGDFNDDLDASTYWGQPSPFTALVADPAYRFTTDALTAAGVSTTVRFSATIDHHLATDELASRYVEGSASVLRVDGWVADFGQTTSDHYPVLTRYGLR